MTAGFGRVVLPLPLAQPYTYSIPETLADRVVPGARVVVPLRQREMVGIVAEVDMASPALATREILSAPDPEPALPLPLLETARWMAGYYGAPLGLSLRAMLPSALWGASHVVVTLADAARAPGGFAGDLLTWLAKKGGEASVTAVSRAFKRPVWDAVNRLARVGAVVLRVEPPETRGGAAEERVVVLTESLPTLVEREKLFRKTPAQRALFEAAEQLGGSVPARHLRERLNFSPGVLRGLVRRGLARIESAQRIRDPFAAEAGVPPPKELTEAQRAAVGAIDALPGGDGALLFGVTSSGKTLVYLEVIRRALASGRGAIILVPEIGLTLQAVSRVRGAFGDQVAVLHSGLSEGERADAWRMLRSGERRVAVGARSAIFAPVADLGVIVVDEEHEASYKNGEAPRYHARDVAAVRARLESARVILGSATPSPESMAKAETGERLRLVRLPERIGTLPMPAVELVDLRTARRVEGVGAFPWSETLDAALEAVLARREQALLLLNRRGYAAYLQCPSCGSVPECPNCSISLTVHQTPPGLRCHYCSHEAPLRERCVACGHPVQQMRGVGTQQVERVISERFPSARVARMDLDTTSTKWSHHRILDAFERGDLDLLIGTQMIAKGLDFPNVTLVGVVDADTGLHLPDFRAGERTFQLLAQVAGRPGRGPKGGLVIVQTRSPSHHALTYAAQHDVEGFLREELTLRLSPPYPPAVSLVNLLVSGRSEGQVSAGAARVADWSRELVERNALEVIVLGPAPAPLARLKDRWRWHVLLKGRREELGRVVRYAAGRITGGDGVRVVIDRDPVSLL